MKYIRKPVIIDAFQYDGDLKGSDGKYYVPDWAVKAYKKGDICYSISGTPEILMVRYGDGGIMTAAVGDYIVVDYENGLYAMDKETFESMYNPVKEPQATNIETYQSITGIILKAEPAVRIGELNYTATEQQPQTGERREQGYRVYLKSGTIRWMNKVEFEMLNTKVLFPKKV